MSKEKRLSQIDPTVVSEIFTKRVAVLAIGGMRPEAIGEELGMTKGAIEAIQKGEKYKDLVARIGEQEMMFAVSRMKTKLVNLGDKTLKVYEKVMDDYLEGKGGARDAVVVAQSVQRALGVEADNGTPQDATINVILPGGSEIVTVKAEVEK